MMEILKVRERQTLDRAGGAGCDDDVRQKVVIRPFDETDSVEVLTDLLHAAFEKGPSQPFDYPAAGQTVQKTSQQLHHGQCLVAVLEGRLVGLGIVYPPEKTLFCSPGHPRAGAQLRQLAVSPEVQGQGIGARLLAACERKAREMGAWNLWGSSPAGSRQLALYLRCGYHRAERVAWVTTNYESVVFSKCLHEGAPHPPLARLALKAHYLLSFLSLRVTMNVAYRAVRHAQKPVIQAGQSVIRRLTKILLGLRRTDTRDVLVCCDDPLMVVDYLAPFWELFRDDKRLRFRIVLPPWAHKRWNPEQMAYVRRRLPLDETGPRWAGSRAWDLVVYSNHCFREIMRGSPSVYIGHGPKCKVLPGQRLEYAYSVTDRKGRSLYRRIFEERQEDGDRAVRENPALRDTVVVVGSLEHDRVLAHAQDREQFRRQLGFGPKDVVVFMLSTWGKDCLWRTMGDELLAAARGLRGEFRFILSAHPHEYRPQPDSERVWGEYLRTQTQYGFIVREPSESWIPYMVASDIVLSDYTGLVEYAVLLEKPIVLTPVPEQAIWQESILGKIRRFAPILKDAGKLRECLVDALRHYPGDQLHELARSVQPYPGQAAERIRKEIYSVLKIPAPPRAERTDAGGDPH